MTRVVRWSATLAATAGAFLLGVTAERLVVDWSTHVVGGVGLALLLLALAGLGLEWWLTRFDRRAAKIRERVTRADRLEAEEQDKQKDKDLTDFWNSPNGQLVHAMPEVIDDSVRILPVEKRPLGDPVETGRFFVYVDNDRVAAFRIDLAHRKRTWRRRVADVNLWLATRSFLAGRPGTTRVFEWVTRRITVKVKRSKTLGAR